MDPDKLDAYWEAITQIEAQATLIALRVADYPNMKKEDRARTHRQFHKLAYPINHESSEVLTTAQLAERIQAAING